MNIEIRYHQVTKKDKLITGIENVKIRLHETWGWTSGDKSKGQSIIEEI